MNSLKTLILTLWCLFLPTIALGQSNQFRDSRDKVAISVHVEPKQAIAGSDIVLAVVLEHDQHWHTHTNAPDVPAVLGSSEDYYKTAIYVEVPDESPLTIHEGYTQWPEPTTVKVGFTGEPVNYGVFLDTTVVYIPVTVSSSAEAGMVPMIIRPVFQACDETTCMAPTPMPSNSSVWTDYGYQVELSIVNPVNLDNKTSNPDVFGSFDSSVFSKIHAGIAAPKDTAIMFDAFGVQFSINSDGTFGLVLLLLVAMGGGFLLNLTPCVLPVIPIKIMSLSAGGGTRKETFVLGIWMTLGVLSLWLSLGIAIAFVSGFTAINQLFQYPAFTIALGLFIGVMAIGMGGLFSIRLPKAVYMFNPKHDSWHGSFGFGITTAVLSTPCTAPFMGAAAAWAATQSPMMTINVFGSIGFGMAVPYLVLAAWPQLLDKMPKAGAASELIKQVMGLLMLAAAAYFLGVGLVSVFQQEGAPPSRGYLWIVSGCVAVAGIWLAWRTVRLAAGTGIRASFVSIGLLLAVASIVVGNRLTDSGPINWGYYTPALLNEKLEEGDVVVLEFTAEWCRNCKLLEGTVLNDPVVAEILGSDGVSPIKIDLTGNNVSGNNLLNEVGGLRIPLLIIMSSHGGEVFRGDFYTVEQIVTAIKQAKELG
ncbi:MAG: cytochrome c biogenesis protein CcdA [Planctomycetota bacterium]|nr:cytochrome c biogenesis protein CcdA [Planctomycetota bacterium]